jgi:hypothetical protein
MGRPLERLRPVWLAGSFKTSSTSCGVTPCSAMCWTLPYGSSSRSQTTSTIAAFCSLRVATFYNVRAERSSACPRRALSNSSSAPGQTRLSGSAAVAHGQSSGRATGPRRNGLSIGAGHRSPEPSCVAWGAGPASPPSPHDGRNAPRVQQRPRGRRLNRTRRPSLLGRCRHDVSRSFNLFGGSGQAVAHAQLPTSRQGHPCVAVHQGH